MTIVRATSQGVIELTKVYVPKSIAHPSICACDNPEPFILVRQTKPFVLQQLQRAYGHTLIDLSVFEPHGPRQISIKTSLVQAVE